MRESRRRKEMEEARNTGHKLFKESILVPVDSLNSSSDVG